MKYDPARLKLLSPEQLAVVQTWMERDRMLEEVFAKELNIKREISCDGLDRIMDIVKSTPEQCAHSRSLWSSCIACDEIEHILWPELFDSDGERVDLK